MPSLPLPNLRSSPSAAAPPRPAAAGSAPQPLAQVPQDLAAGLLIAAFGGAALWLGRDWPTGTLAYVQSGFFPRMIGTLLVLSGLLVAGRGLLRTGAGLPAWGWRPLIGVTVAVLAFAGTLEPLGLVPAVLILVGLGNLAGQPLRPVPLALLGGALAAGCVALFVWGLGLPLPVWPQWVSP